MTITLDTTYTDGRYWSLTGNSGTQYGTHFVGTTDAVSLTLALSGTAALRLEPNATSPNVIGGYSGNSVTAGVYGATIGGGGASGATNRVTGIYGTVGGGYDNEASGDGATVGGGQLNTASGYIATVGGGSDNKASSQEATVGGGYYNTASGLHATVGGGSTNTASGLVATVGGGTNNTASGSRATVPGGSQNTAQGDYSFAAGRRAKANHQGAFVWGDSTDADINSPANNTFIVRASGGVTMYTSSGLGSGATLPQGSGTWSSLSDREAKENFTPIDGQEVLARLAEMPISTWNYKTQDPSTRHIGPVAQDFYAAFGLGESERYISTVDADGVALAAIQELYQRSRALEAENAAQQEQIKALQQQNADLEARLTALEQRPEPIEGAASANSTPPLQSSVLSPRPEARPEGLTKGGLLPKAGPSAMLGAGVLLAGLGLVLSLSKSLPKDLVLSLSKGGRR